MTVNCLIVDDEQHARKLLADYISKIPELNLAGECKNAMEAMHRLRTQQIDLMLLDIQMPDLTGVELLKSLNKKPLVIFTTAYREYAIEGYELDVVDYLLKPVTFERFVHGINKAIDLINLKNQGGAVSQGIPVKVADAETQSIKLKADHKVYKVKTEDILYVEGLKEYVTFYTRERKYVVLESLRNLENTLPSGKFLRVHKSYIINVEFVDSMYGNILEIGDTEIPIGKSFSVDVKKRLFGIG